MVLPEPSQTMAYTPRNTVHRLAREQLHLNKAKPLKVKVSLFVYLILESCLAACQPFVSSVNHLYHHCEGIWNGTSRIVFVEVRTQEIYDRDRDWPVETVGITGLRKNSGRDGGIEEPYW